MTSDSLQPSLNRQGVRDSTWPEMVEIFDTTLRDGVQFEGISVSSDDKLKVARQLDYLGVHWIEGGWPGSNPKDEEFFQRATSELELKTSQLVAFGSTRRPRGRVDEDQTLSSLVQAGTSTVCIVGKSWDYHVTEALRQPLDEGARPDALDWYAHGYADRLDLRGRPQARWEGEWDRVVHGA